MRTPTPSQIHETPPMRDLRVALAAVYHLLIPSGLRRHLLLDLGEFRGFEYYDGLVFEVFAEGLSYEVAGGGATTTLIVRFGRDLPSNRLRSLVRIVLHSGRESVSFLLATLLSAD